MDHIVHGVTKSWIRLSDLHFHFSYPGCATSKKTQQNKGEENNQSANEKY